MSRLVERPRKYSTERLTAKQNDNPEWLSDANIAAFMAEVDAPTTVLA